MSEAEYIERLHKARREALAEVRTWIFMQWREHRIDDAFRDEALAAFRRLADQGGKGESDA